MAIIDRETVHKILDSTDIVEVVKEFVPLRKRGANYWGLCPFHNDRTPSFSVSKSKGIFKCFSCGKAGGAVSFLMEHESISYPEALKYLAKKYNIEINEKEESEEERQADMKRQGMLAANEWAMTKFAENLTQTPEGVNVGLSYFRERGISEQMIERFRLGYALEQYDALVKAAKQEGIKEEYLLETGLCKKKEGSDRVYDMFRGRVMFPVLGISGKVVAFGGRILNKEKSPAKYINSPESTVYVKSREVYGLFQAKRAIEKKEYCILVEGYMDVISMVQAGIENVVAPLGTSLTQEQVHLLHRFTKKIVLVFDNDNAGLKASLRGINLVLAAGLDVSVVILPDGEDPDSFAQKNSSTQVEEYLRDNEQDFVKFQVQVLLGEAQDDPIKKSNVIEEIIKTIAIIPNEIRRLVYCQECARTFGIAEKSLKRQVDIRRSKLREEQAIEKDRQKAHDSIGDIDDNAVEDVAGGIDSSVPIKTGDIAVSGSEAHSQTKPTGQPHVFNGRPGAGRMKSTPDIRDFERNLLTYVVRYGAVKVCDAIDVDGNPTPMNVFEFVTMEMDNDEIGFTDGVNLRLFNEVREGMANWETDRANEINRLEAIRNRQMSMGEEEIKKEAKSLEEINLKEKNLQHEIDRNFKDALKEYTENYVERFLISSVDSEVRNLAVKIATDRHELSKYHSRYAPVPTEIDKLPELVNQSINALKFAILDARSNEICKEITDLGNKGDTEQILRLMEEKQRIDGFKSRFALLLGERVVKG